MLVFFFLKDKEHLQICVCLTISSLTTQEEIMDPNVDVAVFATASITCYFVESQCSFYGPDLAALLTG